MKKIIKGNKYLQRFLWIILFIIIWETCVSRKLFPTQLLPSLKEVGSAFVEGIVEGDLLLQLLMSLLLLFLGFAISIIIATIFCMVGYYSSIFQSLLDVCLVVLHPLPGVAILPLIILWVGIGTKAVLVVMLHSMVWPLIVNLQTGFHHIDTAYLEVAKNNGINKIQMFFYVLLPLSIPNLLAGMKIGWSRGWRALISAEMIFGAIGSVGGIGWYIFEKRVFMDTPGMFAGLLALIMIGFAVEDIFFSKMDHWMEER